MARVIEHAPAESAQIDPNREWLTFGNCLVLNGISPGVFHQVWQEQRPGSRTPLFRNVAEHEYAPQAYMRYLRQNNYYPELLIFNVSSWLNSDNFESDAELLDKQDLLGLRAGDSSSQAVFKVGATGDQSKPTFQNRVESRLHGLLSRALRLSEKHYHLFDFGMFLRSLARTRNLDESLYQLNIQSWYKLKAQHRDGHGQMAFEVGYKSDWAQSNPIMVERQLSRMRLGNFLTKSYWESLETEIENFRSHGTHVVVLRMPEHPDIFKFNEQSYDLGDNLSEMAQKLGVPFLDLNADPSLLEEIQLYDGVHPDQRSSELISRYVANWLSAKEPSWIYSD